MTRKNPDTAPQGENRQATPPKRQNKILIATALALGFIGGVGANHAVTEQQVVTAQVAVQNLRSGEANKQRSQFENSVGQQYQDASNVYAMVTAGAGLPYDPDLMSTLMTESFEESQKRVSSAQTFRDLLQTARTYLKKNPSSDANRFKDQDLGLDLLVFSFVVPSGADKIPANLAQYALPLARIQNFINAVATWNHTIEGNQTNSLNTIKEEQGKMLTQLVIDSGGSISGNNVRKSAQTFLTQLFNTATSNLPS